MSIANSKRQDVKNGNFIYFDDWNLLSGHLFALQHEAAQFKRQKKSSRSELLWISMHEMEKSTITANWKNVELF